MAPTSRPNLQRAGLAAWHHAWMVSDRHSISPRTSALQQGTAIEVFITFALMASIYWSVVKSETHVSIAFFVGGATVAVLAYFFGPLTGASMNPARTFGPNLVNWNGLRAYPFYSITTVALEPCLRPRIYVRLLCLTEKRSGLSS